MVHCDSTGLLPNEEKLKGRIIINFDLAHRQRILGCCTERTQLIETRSKIVMKGAKDMNECKVAKPNKATLLY